MHHALDIRIFHKEARSLAVAGYDVAVIAPHQHDEERDGVQIVALRHYARRPLRMTVGAARGLAACLRHRADVYHFHDPELLPWMALLMLLRPRARVVYDMHEDLPRAVLTKSWIAAPLRWLTSGIVQLLERVCAAGMGVVFAEESYRAGHRWAGRSVTVLNLPPTAELAAIREPKRARPTVVYFGAVNVQRGSRQMIEALALLNQRGIDAELELIGYIRAAHMRELEQLAAERGVQIRIHGLLQPQEGWRLVAQCHVGLALLHPLPNYLESYPTKLFEYAALGLPVIASDFPLYRRLMDQLGCGVCVDPLDPPAIADALAELLSNPQCAALLAGRGREVVQGEFSWENEARKLLSFYKDLLNQPS